MYRALTKESLREFINSYNRPVDTRKLVIQTGQIGYDLSTTIIQSAHLSHIINELLKANKLKPSEHKNLNKMINSVDTEDMILAEEIILNKLNNV